MIDNKRQRYIIISRFPPPLGGVSVFAQRKAADLTAKGYSVTIVDLGKRLWWFQLFRLSLLSGDDQFLINTLNPIILLLLFVLKSLGRSCLYDHNASRLYLDSAIKRRFLVYFAARAARVVVVHRRLCSFYEQFGITPKVESPFLPPDESRIVEIVRHYPQSLWRFIDSTNHCILLNSAWRYVLSPDGTDIYGFKESMDLLKTLSDRNLLFRMVFAVGDFRHNCCPRELIQRINRFRSAGILYLLHGQHEIWPLFRYVDIFLRTTATDGESISVLEALHYKCPVIVSDVVPRPNGVVTYKYGNAEDLVQSVVKNLPSKRKHLISYSNAADVEG